MNLGHVPKPVYLTQTVIQLFGPTPGCRKCLAGMSSERCDLPHTPECRERLTDLMRQDDRYRSLVEAADERQVMRVAEILDMKDEASRKQRKQQREEQRRSADAGARGTGEAFGSQREDPGGPAHAGTRSTGGASGSQWFGVDRKRQADHQLQPDDCDGDGDCQMGIPLPLNRQLVIVENVEVMITFHRKQENLLDSDPICYPSPLVPENCTSSTTSARPGHHHHHYYYYHHHLHYHLHLHRKSLLQTFGFRRVLAPWRPSARISFKTSRTACSRCNPAAAPPRPCHERQVPGRL